MPSWINHLIAGLIVWSLLTIASIKLGWVVGLPELATLPIMLAYSILPDVDAPASKVRRIVEVALLLIAGGAIITHAVFLALASIAVIIFLWLSGHRKIFHSSIAALVLSVPLLFIYSSWFGAALSGYMLHLIMDGELK